MSKQMDLREALLWCYQNRGESLEVSTAVGGQPVQIKMDKYYQIQGQHVGGHWECAKDWWDVLTRPHTRFQIPEESTLPAEISKAIDSLEGICESGKKGVRKLVKEILEAKVKP